MKFILAAALLLTTACLSFLAKERQAFDENETLLGIDLNQNGVRDDVESLIKADQTLSATGKAILMAGAKAYQMALKSTTTQTASDSDNDKASNLMMSFISCLSLHYKDDRRLALSKLKTLHLNTEKRVNAYLAYNQSRNGTIQNASTKTPEQCQAFSDT